jgi:hypothetical protein
MPGWGEPVQPLEADDAVELQEEAMRTENDKTGMQPQCPAGHTGDDIMIVQTVNGGWWPVCLRCLSMPPSDEARSRPAGAT